MDDFNDDHPLATGSKSFKSQIPVMWEYLKQNYQAGRSGRIFNNFKRDDKDRLEFWLFLANKNNDFPKKSIEALFTELQKNPSFNHKTADYAVKIQTNLRKYFEEQLNLEKQGALSGLTFSKEQKQSIVRSMVYSVCEAIRKNYCENNSATPPQNLSRLETDFAEIMIGAGQYLDKPEEEEEEKETEILLEANEETAKKVKVLDATNSKLINQISKNPVEYSWSNFRAYFLKYPTKLSSETLASAINAFVNSKECRQVGIKLAIEEIISKLNQYENVHYRDIVAKAIKKNLTDNLINADAKQFYNELASALYTYQPNPRQVTKHYDLSIELFHLWKDAWKYQPDLDEIKSTLQSPISKKRFKKLEKLIYNNISATLHDKHPLDPLLLYHKTSIFVDSFFVGHQLNAATYQKLKRFKNAIELHAFNDWINQNPSVKISAKPKAMLGGDNEGEDGLVFDKKQNSMKNSVVGSEKILDEIKNKISLILKCSISLQCKKNQDKKDEIDKHTGLIEIKNIIEGQDNITSAELYMKVRNISDEHLTRTQLMFWRRIARDSGIKKLYTIFQETPLMIIDNGSLVPNTAKLNALSAQLNIIIEDYHTQIRAIEAEIQKTSQQKNKVIDEDDYESDYAQTK
jgi:hypothetical protein